MIHHGEAVSFVHRNLIRTLRERYPFFDFEIVVQRLDNQDGLRIAVVNGYEQFLRKINAEDMFGKMQGIMAIKDAAADGARAVYIASHGCTP